MLLDGIDTLVLARAQFALTVSSHFVFPAISVGLAGYLFSPGIWRSGLSLNRSGSSVPRLQMNS